MKLKKVVLILSLIIILVVFFTINSMAAYDSADIGDFAGETTEASGKVQTALGGAIASIQLIGLGVAVVMLVVLAIKYMMSSASDRAEIKKHAVIYIVGAVIMFGAAGILEIIKNFANKVV